ncbi:MAG: hypothetical protein HY886_09680 [Deltaproteobacteria bacterium]|nr:hypothetical protein [Deltaproteobacteria bacterium]
MRNTSRKIIVLSHALLTAPLDRIDSPKAVKTVIRAEELVLGAASVALKKAGEGFVNGRMAVVFGGDEAIDGPKEEYFKGVMTDKAIGASPLLFPYTSLNAVTAQITIAFGIKGEFATFASGPVSFLKALVYACELLKEGVVDFALAGGFSEKTAFAMTLTASDRNGAVELTTERVKPNDIDVYDEARITSIEDSFALAQRLMDKHGTIKAVDKSGANVVFIRTVCHEQGL